MGGLSVGAAKTIDPRELCGTIIAMVWGVIAALLDASDSGALNGLHER